VRIFPSDARPARRKAARNAGDDYGATASPDWRTIDWREHLNQAQIAGRRVNYVDIGSGDSPPVVFIHGLGGCWQNWLENIPRVSQERRVIAMDMPGHAYSEMPAEEISISGYGRCVNELCEVLDLGPVELVGNSMGGFIAAETAIAFPERVDRLVLCAAAGITTTSVRREPAVGFYNVMRALASFTVANQNRLFTRPVLRHWALALIARHPSRLKPDLTIEMARGAWSDGLLPALEAILAYDFRDRLPEIGAPTLVVWGGEDMIVPTKDADEFERLIPDSRKVVMEDTGHVPMIERPETFNELLLDFLAEKGEAEEQPKPEAASV
jgi:pimeloyl-ACP methyl ester carboxylesterase